MDCNIIAASPETTKKARTRSKHIVVLHTKLPYLHAEEELVLSLNSLVLSFIAFNTSIHFSIIFFMFFMPAHVWQVDFVTSFGGKLSSKFRFQSGEIIALQLGWCQHQSRLRPKSTKIAPKRKQWISPHHHSQFQPRASLNRLKSNFDGHNWCRLRANIARN